MFWSDSPHADVVVGPWPRLPSPPLNGSAQRVPEDQLCGHPGSMGGRASPGRWWSLGALPFSPSV